MEPDPTTETDRKLLDRLLPGWVIEDSQDGAMVRLDGLFFELGLTPDLAIAAAASTLRAILARDRETNGDALGADCKALVELAREWSDYAAEIESFSNGCGCCSTTYAERKLAQHRVTALLDSPEVKAAIARHGGGA